MVIWKFPIRPNAFSDRPYELTILAPPGAKVISVGIQDGNYYAWAECNPNGSQVAITLYSVGTGFGMVPVGCRFVGTIIDQENALVWHIYQPN